MHNRDEYLTKALIDMEENGTRHDLYLVTVHGYSLDSPAAGLVAWIMVGTVEETVRLIRQHKGWERFTPTRITLTAPEMIFRPHVIDQN